MAYSKVHSRHELGNLVFYDAQYRQRWLDAIGPTAVVFKEDFAGDILANWTSTSLGATSGVASYDAEGGCILLYTGGTDGDGYELQKLSGFKLVDDCPCYFGARWKITGTTGAGSSSIFIGLAAEDTSLIASTNDAVYFDSASAGTGLNFIMETGGAETSAVALTTIVVDTWYVNEFYWDGDDTVTAYHQGAAVATGSAASMDQTQRMSVSLGWQDEAGHASGSTGMVVDWVRAIQLLDVRNA